MNGAQLFVACLVEEGVREVFGVPGEETLDLVEALRTSPIRLIVTRHEQHAAFMAATHGRLTGRAGVCLSTLGPGALNLVTGIAHAQLGGMPLVAVTGQKPVRDNRQGAFQLVDVVGTFEPLTKWNASLGSVRVIPRSVRHAFKTAESERPGAVHLELPEDIAHDDASHLAPHRRAPLRRPVADDVAVKRAARLIRESRNPVAIVSAGANRKRVGHALASFVEQTGAYVVSTQMGKGVLPEDHPRALFSLGLHRRDWVHTALDAADLVITVGYNIVEYPPALWNRDPDGQGAGKKTLHVDFVPAEPDAFYNPDCEVVGDISHSLRAIAACFTEPRPPSRTMAAARAEIARHLFEEPCAECHPPSPRAVVRDVRAAMGPDDIVSLDNGIYKIWFARMYRTVQANTLLLDNALATMGAGLAAAMSTKMVYPERKVLAVCGDGGFMMNSQDLETAVRLGLDLVVLVLRDDGYGFIRWKQQDAGLPDFAMSFGNPDFVRYAVAYGATGMRLEKGDRLDKLIDAAFAQGGVVLIDCPVDYTENRLLSRDVSRELMPFLKGGAS